MATRDPDPEEDLYFPFDSVSEGLLTMPMHPSADDYGTTYVAEAEEDGEPRGGAIVTFNSAEDRGFAVTDTSVYQIDVTPATNNSLGRNETRLTIINLTSDDPERRLPRFATLTLEGKTSVIRFHHSGTLWRLKPCSDVVDVPSSSIEKLIEFVVATAPVRALAAKRQAGHDDEENEDDFEVDDSKPQSKAQTTTKQDAIELSSLDISVAFVIAELKCLADARLIALPDEVDELMSWACELPLPPRAVVASRPPPTAQDMFEYLNRTVGLSLNEITKSLGYSGKSGSGDRTRVLEGKSRDLDEKLRLLKELYELHAPKNDSQLPVTFKEAITRLKVAHFARPSSLDFNTAEQAFVYTIFKLNRELDLYIQLEERCRAPNVKFVRVWLGHQKACRAKHFNMPDDEESAKKSCVDAINKFGNRFDGAVRTAMEFAFSRPGNRNPVYVALATLQREEGEENYLQRLVSQRDTIKNINNVIMAGRGRSWPFTVRYLNSLEEQRVRERQLHLVNNPHPDDPKFVPMAEDLAQESIKSLAAAQLEAALAEWSDRTGGCTLRFVAIALAALENANRALQSRDELRHVIGHLLRDDGLLPSAADLDVLYSALAKECERIKQSAIAAKDDLRSRICVVVQCFIYVTSVRSVQLLRSLWYGRKSTNAVPTDFDTDGRSNACSCSHCQARGCDGVLFPEHARRAPVAETYQMRALLYLSRCTGHGARVTVHQVANKARTYSVPESTRLQGQATSYSIGTMVIRSLPCEVESAIKEATHAASRSSVALTIDNQLLEVGSTLSSEGSTLTSSASLNMRFSNPSTMDSRLPTNVTTTSGTGRSSVIEAQSRPTSWESFADNTSEDEKPRDQIQQSFVAFLHTHSVQLTKIFRDLADAHPVPAPEFQLRYKNAPEVPAAFDGGRDITGSARAEQDPLASRILFHDFSPFHMDLDKVGGDKGTARREFIRDCALDTVAAVDAIQHLWNQTLAVERDGSPALLPWNGLLSVIGIATSPLSARIRAEDFAYSGAVPRSVVTEYMPLSLDDVLDGVLPFRSAQTPNPTFEMEYDRQMLHVVTSALNTIVAVHRRKVGFISLTPSNIFVGHAPLSDFSFVTKIGAFNHMRLFGRSLDISFRGDTWNSEFRNYSLWIAIESPTAATAGDSVSKRVKDAIKKLGAEEFCKWSDYYSMGMIILEYLLKRTCVFTKQTISDVRKKNSGSALVSFITEARVALAPWLEKQKATPDIEPKHIRVIEDLMALMTNCFSVLKSEGSEALKSAREDLVRLLGNVTERVDNWKHTELSGQFVLCPFTGSIDALSKRTMKLLASSKNTLSFAPQATNSTTKDRSASGASNVARRLLCAVDNWLYYTMHPGINTTQVRQWLNRRSDAGAEYAIAIRGGTASKIIEPNLTLEGTGASTGTQIDVVPRLHGLIFLDTIAQIAGDPNDNDSKLNAPELMIALDSDRVAIVYSAPQMSLATFIAQPQASGLTMSAKDALIIAISIGGALVALQRLKLAHFNVGLWSVEKCAGRGGSNALWKLGALDRAAFATTRRMTRNLAQSLVSPFYGVTPIRPPSSNDENGYVADSRALMTMLLGLLSRIHEPRSEITRLIEALLASDLTRGQTSLSKPIFDVAMGGSSGRRLFNAFKIFVELERQLGTTENGSHDGKRCIARMFAAIQRVTEHRVIPSSLMNDLRMAEQVMPQDEEGMESYLRAMDVEALPGGGDITSLVIQSIWDVIDNRAADVVSMRTNKQYEKVLVAWRALASHIALWFVSLDFLRQANPNAKLDDFSTDRARIDIAWFLQSCYNNSLTIDAVYSDAAQSEGEGGLKCTAIKLWLFKLLSFIIVNHMKIRQSMLSALHAYICEFYSQRVRRTCWTGDQWKLFRPSFLPQEDMWGLPYTAPALVAPVNPTNIPLYSAGAYAEAARALSSIFMNNTYLVSRWVPQDDGALQRDLADRLQVFFMQFGPDKETKGTNQPLNFLAEAPRQLEAITQRFVARYDISPIEVDVEFSGCTNTQYSEEKLPIHVELKHVDIDSDGSKTWYDYLRMPSVPTGLRRMTSVFLFERQGDLDPGKPRFSVILGLCEGKGARPVLRADLTPKFFREQGAEAPPGASRDNESRSLSRLLRAATLNYYTGPQPRSLEQEMTPICGGRLWYFNVATAKHGEESA